VITTLKSGNIGAGEDTAVTNEFKIGEHVTWSYEGGAASGVITEKVTSEIMFKGYVRHASDKDPQYIIKSDQTNHLAMHRGTVLRRAKKLKIRID
jgi:hypothetical protein